MTRAPIEELISEYWPLAIGLCVLVHLLFELWTERASRNWPTTKATHTEIPPKSKFERNGSRWRWKNSSETDCAIVYKVNGKEYVTRIEELASFSVNGQPMSRTTGLPPSFEVRYQEQNPEKIYYRHAYSPFAKKALVTLELAISLAAFFFFFYARHAAS